MARARSTCWPCSAAWWPSVVRLLLLNNKRFHFRLMCFVRAHQKSIASTAIKQWPICVALNARTQEHRPTACLDTSSGWLLCCPALRIASSRGSCRSSCARALGQPPVNRSKSGRSTHRLDPINHLPHRERSFHVCGLSSGRGRAAWVGWPRRRRGAARGTADVKAAFTVQLVRKVGD